MKKVLLIVIDALATRVVEPAMDDGRLPNLSRIVDTGIFRRQCTSIFPSITPAATGAIATGRYPVDHQIAGAFWYDREHQRVAYYCDDFWVLVNEGLGKFFSDFLIKLNYERLKSDTVFEHVERAGLSAGVINYMWFRGDVDHQVDTPLLMKLLPGLSLASRIRGPKLTALGDFVHPTLNGSDEPLQALGGVTRRYGFHDQTTADYLLKLADADALPDFTLAYFPNNDFESHRVGPEKAVSVLEEIDTCLGHLIDTLGGLEQFLDHYAVLVTGDHSQSDMPDGGAAEQGIDLTEILSDYQIVPAGKNWSDGDELMVCPNMRAAQIYSDEGSDAVRRGELVRQLLKEPRIDQVLWTEDEPNGRQFHVATADRGTLRFRRVSASVEADGTDIYGNSWVWDGDLQTIDARCSGSGEIEYGVYPNALERIAGGFSPVSGDVWLTCRLGTEFRVPETELHPGGSHGSLHELDSTAPLIVAGVPSDIQVPQNPRIVDVAPLCMQILGVPTQDKDQLANTLGHR